MQTLFDYLLELHGQHNHTLLINPSTHVEILDEYGKLTDLRDEVSTCYQNWQKLESKINEFKRFFSITLIRSILFFSENSTT